MHSDSPVARLTIPLLNKVEQCLVNVQWNVSLQVVTHLLNKNKQHPATAYEYLGVLV